MSGADLWEDGYPHGTVEGYKGFGEGGCRGGSCPGIEWGLTCKQANTIAHSDYRYGRWVKEGKTPQEIAQLLRDDAAAATIPAHERPKPGPPKRHTAVDDDMLDAEARTSLELAGETFDVDEPSPIPQPATQPPALSEPVEHELAGIKNLVTQGAAQPLAESSQETEPLGMPGDEPETEEEAPAEGTPVAEVEETGHFETFEPITTDRWTTGLNDRQKREVLSSIRNWAHTHGYPGVPTRGRIPQDALAAYAAAHDDPPTVGELIDRGRELMDSSVLDIAHRSDQLDETRARISNSPEVERPEWGDVAAAEDVRRARATAVRPEQELAKTEEAQARAEAGWEESARCWEMIADHPAVERIRAHAPDLPLVEAALAALDGQAAAQSAMRVAIEHWAATHDELLAVRRELKAERAVNEELRQASWVMARLRRVDAQQRRRWARRTR